MQPLSSADLEELIRIMRDMYDSATNSNWQELARLDSERRALLRFDPTVVISVDNKKSQNVWTEKTHSNAFITTMNNCDEIFHREALVAEISELDAQIIQTVQNQRQRLLDENRGLSAQSKAKKLYAQTSAMT